MEYTRSPRIPENLRFISVEEIENMRHEQEAAVVNAGGDAISGLSLIEAFENGIKIRDEVQQNFKEEINNVAVLYVANHLNRDDNEELFDGCVDLVKRYSVLNMTDSEWRAGERSADGSYDKPETAGQRRLWNELTELVPIAETPDTSDEDDLDEDLDEDYEHETTALELVALQGALESSRANLAQLSIKRRAMVRKSGGKAKRLQEAYDTAQQQYDAALKAMGVHAINELRAAGETDNDIALAVIMGTISERQAFTQAEADKMAADNSKRAKFLRWYGQLPIMIGANTAGGFALGFGAQKLVKLGFIAALPIAGVAGLAAVKVGKSLLTSSLNNGVQLHKTLDKRGAQDIKAMHDMFDSNEVNVAIGPDVTAENYAEFSQKLVKQSIDNRVQKDIRNNRTRAVVAGVMAGGFAVGGAILADKLQHVASSGGGGGRDQLTNDTLIRAGVTDPNVRADILAHPDAFKHMVTHPDSFGQLMEHSTPHSLPLATGTPTPGLGNILQSTETFAIPRGGGIIHDVIRPFASNQGMNLSPAQETHIWKAVQTHFGDNIFTDLAVKPHGVDQWISRPGNATLRPELAEFIRQQLASTSV